MMATSRDKYGGGNSIRAFISSSLTAKLVGLLAAALLLYGVVDLSILRFAIYPQFAKIERREAGTDLGRVISVLEREITHLDTLCRDWAFWDDTYEFILTRSPQYVKSNLPLTTFTDNWLHLLFILNDRGEVVWGRSFDHSIEKDLPLHEFPRDVVNNNHPLLAQGGASGLINTEFGPMLVAARPVMTSDGRGPSRGTLIMGRFVTHDFLEKLLVQTGVNFDITDLLVDGVSASSTSRSISENDKTTLLLTGAFPGLGEYPGVQITVKKERDITREGESVLRFALYSFLAAGVALLILVGCFVRNAVLRPVCLLTGHMSAVMETDDLSKRIGFKRNDEIGTLGAQYDAMLSLLTRNKQALFEDIEKRKEVERALRESEERYRRVLETVPSSITITTEQEGRYLEVNKAFTNLSGYSRKEVLGATPFDLNLFVDPDDRDRFLDLLRRDGEVNELGIQYRRKSGTVVDMLLSARRINFSETECIVVVATDISEKLKQEQHLRQAQKLEAIGTLAGGVAHDFNNILTGILGFSQIALLQIGNESEVRENLKKVIEASHRAGDLVAQILAFNRESKQQFKAVRVQAVVQEALELCRASLPSTVRVRQYVQTDVIVMGDSTQVHQVVLNLCTNAGHAMGQEEGVLTVELSEVWLDHDFLKLYPAILPGKFAKLSVFDTGCGIASSDMERIFDPFFSTKQKGKGTGLGLSVVHGIVKAHGGMLEVKSREGQGTEVVVFLPAGRGKQEQKMGKAPLAVGNGTVTPREKKSLAC